jgi:uncharacterized membrane protein YciS (DUF1049 family)
MLALIWLAVARAHSQFDTSKALTWLLAGGFALTTIALAALYVRMETAALRCERSG